MFAAPIEGALKNFMEFGEPGFTDHEQAPPHQRTHAASVGAPSVDSRISARLCYRENSFAETFESLGMKFPEPTVNIKEIARKYHHAELEEEKKIEKSKWKELTTEAKRDKVSKKDGKTAPKGEGAKKSERATQHGQEAQLSEVPETKEPEEGDNSH